MKTSWRTATENAIAELKAKRNIPIAIQWGSSDKAFEDTLATMGQCQALIVRDGQDFELSFAPGGDPDFPDVCEVTCELFRPLPFSCVADVLAECYDGVRAVLATDDRKELVILCLSGALPVESINGRTLDWLLFGLVASKDAITSKLA